MSKSSQASSRQVAPWSFAIFCIFSWISFWSIHRFETTISLEIVIPRIWHIYFGCELLSKQEYDILFQFEHKNHHSDYNTRSISLPIRLPLLLLYNNLVLPVVCMDFVCCGLYIVYRSQHSYDPCVRYIPSRAQTIFPYKLPPNHHGHQHYRIGEAANPGPDNDIEFRITLANPTTVFRREEAIADLQSHLIGLAETSATQKVQYQVQKRMKQLGYDCNWSLPVDNHRPGLTGDESTRGQASGVALMSQLPMQPHRLQLAEPKLTDTRLHFSFVQFGATQILIGFFYGFSNNNLDAKKDTDKLLASAAEIMIGHHGPSILLGDFNHDLHTLGAADTLFNAGFVDILTIHRHICQDDMPCTYRGQSTRDLMTFSAELAGLVSSIRIQTDSEFPGHSPVHVSIRLPSGGLTKQMWRIPKDWTELKPNPTLFQQAYEKLGPITLGEDVATNIEQWSLRVEIAVDRALKLQHQQSPEFQPNNGLPKAYRGKGTPPKIQAKKFVAFTPKARPCDFDPQVEVRSVATTQVIRQLRRIQSIIYRFRKLDTYTDIRETTWIELQNEWKAIIKAKGFHQPFSSWVCNILGWMFFPCALPNIDILLVLEEAVRSYAEILIQQDHKTHLTRSYVNQQLDHQNNHDRQAYAAIREPPNQHITSLRTQRTIGAKVLECDEFDVVVALTAPYALPPGFQVHIRTHPYTLLRQEDDIIFRTKEIPTEHPEFDIDEQIDLQITYDGMQPQDIHAALSQYWEPIWQRDTVEEATDWHQWEQFHRQLQTYELPQLCEHIELNCEQTWQKVISQLNAASAPGADGWYFSEIKALPLQAVRDLTQIFVHPSFTGFPPSLMKARIVALPKKQQVIEATHTRPITVLPSLYRLWTAAIAHIALEKSSNVLPTSIIGFVKKRSSLKSMYHLAFLLEQAHTTGSNLAGLTLDLSKCFNRFPRVPICLILQQMGIPQPILQSWLHSLNHTTKYFDHRGWISPPVESTTGVAEGDSFSILAMIGVTVYWHQQIHEPGLNIMAYADNLSWHSEDFQQHNSENHNRILPITSYPYRLEQDLGLDCSQGQSSTVD